MGTTVTRNGESAASGAGWRALTIFFGHDLPKRSGSALLAAYATGVGLLLLQFLGGGVNQRINAQGLSDETRLDIYRSTLHMIAEHPWFGTGLGTFVWSFPSYRSSKISLDWVWDLAHSTPLELIADLGIPLAAVIGFGWIVILTLLIRAVSRRRRDRILWRRSLLRSSVCCIPWWTSACKYPAMRLSYSQWSGWGWGSRFELRTPHYIKKAPLGSLRSACV